MKAIDWTKIQKKYKGQWVGLKKDQVTVIAHGKTPREVLEKSKKKGYDMPILTRMPEKVMLTISTPFFDYAKKEIEVTQKRKYELPKSAQLAAGLLKHKRKELEKHAAKIRQKWPA